MKITYKKSKFDLQLTFCQTVDQDQTPNPRPISLQSLSPSHFQAHHISSSSSIMDAHFFSTKPNFMLKPPMFAVPTPIQPATLRKKQCHHHHGL